MKDKAKVIIDGKNLSPATLIYLAAKKARENEIKKDRYSRKGIKA